MGEFADYALDETMEAEFDRFLYRNGHMHDAEAYERGIIDESGFYNHPAGNKTQPKCKFCSMPNLSWSKTANGWRLVDNAGNIHSCSKHKFIKD